MPNPPAPADITAARAAASDASDASDQAAARHAAQRCRLAALLVLSLLPHAETVVFDKDEDTVSAETLLSLVAIHDAHGALVWFERDSEFSAHPQALDLGDPPTLAYEVLGDVAMQLRIAYDASPGYFTPNDDGAEVMPSANLLELHIPSALAAATPSGTEATASATIGTAAPGTRLDAARLAAGDEWRAAANRYAAAHAATAARLVMLRFPDAVSAAFTAARYDGGELRADLCEVCGAAGGVLWLWRESIGAPDEWDTTAIEESLAATVQHGGPAFLPRERGGYRLDLDVGLEGFPVATHDCGMCDGPLLFAGTARGVRQWRCPGCGWTHTANDCCTEATTAARDSPEDDDA